MPKRTARRHVRRPTGVERLEPRQLLTSAPWIVAGDADPSAPDDLIVVALDPTNAAVLQVTVNGSVMGSRPVACCRPIASRVMARRTCGRSPRPRSTSAVR